MISLKVEKFQQRWFQNFTARQSELVERGRVWIKIKLTVNDII